jgi:hypothetical protein
MVRKALSLSLLVASGVACTVASVDPSSHGETRQPLVGVDTTHTNVGAVVRRSASGSVSRFCSGVLISPTVFLTAGHCTTSAAGYVASGFSVGVSFDLTIGNASPVVSGVPVTNPAYKPAAYNLNDDTQDLGVIVLDTPVTDRAPAILPASDLLVTPRPAPGTPITAVGYGLDADGTSGHNVTYANDKTRNSGTIAFRAATAYITGDQVRAGSGGVCFGDSGGPDFMTFAGQELLVAISVLVNGYDCNEVAWLQRLDTSASRAFLGAYVALP